MSRNFGIGSRDMGMAGQFALNNATKDGSVSFSTASTNGERWQSFTAWAKDHDVKKMENFTQELVTQYGRDLAEKVNDGKLSPATAQNYVSAVNSVMAIATKNEWKSVSPTKDCNIPQRSMIRQEAPGAINNTTVIQVIALVQEKLGDRAAAVVELARSLGLRSKEASLINARAALKQALTKESVTVGYGTKGGFAREVPITSPAQLQVLERAAAAQGGDRSMIPAGQSWRTWRESTLREARKVVQERTGGGLHDLRASYACQRYQTMTGQPAPCTGALIKDRAGDLVARKLIAKELGHSRFEVTAEYVGGRK